MFTFFHTYHEKTWDAFVNNGFIRKNSGVRCMLHVKMHASQKFGSVLFTDNPLSSLLDGSDMPFYFDRLQGGICFDENSTVTRENVNACMQKYGDRFWGFQMHEWASNFKNDFDRLREYGVLGDTQEHIKDALVKAFPQLPAPFVEAQSCKELAGQYAAKTPTEQMRRFFAMFDKRMALTNGMLIPADSFYMCPKGEIGAGVRRLMPEVGNQIPGTRIQMAYTRGMARAARIPFGAYYEPWGGEPFSTCTNTSCFDEWGIGSSEGCAYEVLGENGGSSRALQKRLMWYLYFSGVQFISEEWGLANSFVDMESMAISEYGNTKLTFLKDIEDFGDRGDILTPIAIVLPKDLEVLELESPWTDTENAYLGIPYENEHQKARNARIHNVLNALFGFEGEAKGNEWHVITNSRYPDAFDIIHADNEEALKQYEYLLDLTDDESLAKKHGNIIALDEIPEALKKCYPVTVEGTAQYMVNRTADGMLLILFNHNGIYRSVETGDKLLENASVNVRLTFNRPANVRFPSDAKVQKDGESYRLTLAGSSMTICRFTMQ